jgi:Dyp-type peroxidase family
MTTSYAGEPLLELDDIQGNVVPGFNKDFQALHFFQISDLPAFRATLPQLSTWVATAREVLDFNRLYKSTLQRRDATDGVLCATWLNIGFTYQALRTITAGTPNSLDSTDFDDPAFRAGMAARAVGELGDPATGVGSPGTWQVGGPNQPVDGVLIVGSDVQSFLDPAVACIKDIVKGSVTWLTHVDRGNVLKGKFDSVPKPLTIEHFGFADGISQPQLRGRTASDPLEYLTPRNGETNLDLVWPGEFVFGYQGQDPAKPREQPGPDRLEGPAWARNGSFLVFRRLHQDVPGFQQFVDTQANLLGISSDEMAALLVGRQRDGTPLIKPSNGNDFVFWGPNGDDNGAVCPWASHIRKANPRNDIHPEWAVLAGANPTRTSTLSAWETQAHRLLRRGIPYGPAFSPTAPEPPNTERGLLFLAYQASIERQFEHVTKSWINHPDFHDQGAGQDLLVGQNDSGTSRERSLRLVLPNGTTEAITTTNQWVVTTGGEYFFVPSISALQTLATSSGPSAKLINNGITEGNVTTSTPTPPDGDFNALIVKANPYIKPEDSQKIPGNPVGSVYPELVNNSLNRAPLNAAEAQGTSIEMAGPAQFCDQGNNIYANSAVQQAIMQYKNCLFWDFEGEPQRVIKAIRVPYTHTADYGDGPHPKTDYILIGFVGIQPP